jgi:protein phosphatase PTC1
VCDDQDAVDLIRNTQDPQVASKQLVDHALQRFSTDNLSCMVVRFDNKALKQTLDRQTQPIGVEGDAISAKGVMSEADAIIKEARKSMSIPDGLNVEEHVHHVSQDIIREERDKESGPEMDPNGVGHTVQAS